MNQMTPATGQFCKKLGCCIVKNQINRNFKQMTDGQVKVKFCLFTVGKTRQHQKTAHKDLATR